MKFLFSFLMLIIGFTTVAQLPTLPVGNPNPSSNGYMRYGYVRSDSGWLVPRRDTMWKAVRPAVVYWEHAGVDTAFWYYNMTKWQKLNGSGGSGSVEYVVGGTGILVDSAGRTYTVKADTGRATMQLVTGGTLWKVLDSLAALTPTTFSYVDTIYRKAGQDSIFFTINGGAERAIKDSLGSGGADTTGLGSLYIRNQQAVQEDKRLRIKSAFFDSLSASGSGGLNMYSNNGTHIAMLGSGGGATAVFYGFSGYNSNIANTYTARSFTDKNYVDSSLNTRVGIDSIAMRRYGNTLARNIRSFNAGGQTASAAVVNQSSSTADSSNIVLGYLAGRDLTTGYRNYFIGDNAGLTATTAHSNVIIGYGSYGGINAKTGSANVAIGLDALRNASSAGASVAIGFQALTSLTTAGSTIAIGNRAAKNITTGTSNVVVGNYNNDNQMTALSSNNTHMGASAGFVSAALNNTTFMGASAGEGASGNNNSGFGRNSLISATGANNVGIGYYTGTNGGASTLSGNNNTLLGSGAKPISYSADNQFTIWAGASTATGAGGGSGGYNVLSRNSSGQWIFNQTTSEVTSISSGAAVEINGTTGGFLMPRMTASQRGAISSPATGLQVYDLDSLDVFTYNGTRWFPSRLTDYANSTLGSPVTMTTAGTFYTGATIVLPAGTWLLTGQIAFTVPGATGTHTIEGRIYNGTVAVASSHQVVPASGQRPASLSFNTAVVLTGNTTFTLDLTSNVNNGQINAVTVTSSQAAATQMTAVRLR